MKHFLLVYEADTDYAEKRQPLRAAHLEAARAAAARGELLMAGALTDPIDSSVFLFAGETPDQAIAFAKADPYVTAGIIKTWRVREWSTVVGPLAANPL